MTGLNIPRVRYEDAQEALYGRDLQSAIGLAAAGRSAARGLRDLYSRTAGYVRGMAERSAERRAEEVELARQREAEQLRVGGLLAATFGVLTEATAAMTETRSRRSEILSAADDAALETLISQQNARRAEAEAQTILEAAQQQIGRRRLLRGLERGSQRASIGGRGVEIGAGSAAEAVASYDLAAEIDVLNLNTNARRAAASSRTAAVNFRNRALLSRASEIGLRATAGSLSPGRAFIGAALAQAGQVASKWHYRN